MTSHLQPRQSRPEDQGENSLPTPCFLPTCTAQWDGARPHASNRGVYGLLAQPQRAKTMLQTLKAKVPKLGKPVRTRELVTRLTHGMVLRVLLKAGSPQSLEIKSFLIIPK